MKSISPKKLFLIDGIGALISAVLIGVILTKINELIGIALPVLQFLAIPPVAFAVFSFNYFLNLPKNWKLYLTIIAIANLLYCLLTTGVILYYSETISNLGLSYFIAEIIVILVLVSIEFKTVKTIPIETNG